MHLTAGDAAATRLPAELPWPRAGPFLQGSLGSARHPGRLRPPALFSPRASEAGEAGDLATKPRRRKLVGHTNKKATGFLKCSDESC